MRLGCSRFEHLRQCRSGRDCDTDATVGARRPTCPRVMLRVLIQESTMKFSSTKWMRLAALVMVLALLTSCGFRRKKYENPIASDTEQPDKVLFDKAIGDLERGRYEVARLTLQ